MVRLRCCLCGCYLVVVVFCVLLFIVCFVYLLFLIGLDVHCLACWFVCFDFDFGVMFVITFGVIVLVFLFILNIDCGVFVRVVFLLLFFCCFVFVWLFDVWFVGFCVVDLLRKRLFVLLTLLLVFVSVGCCCWLMLFMCLPVGLELVFFC